MYVVPWQKLFEQLGHRLPDCKDGCSLATYVEVEIYTGVDLSSAMWQMLGGEDDVGSAIFIPVDNNHVRSIVNSEQRSIFMAKRCAFRERPDAMC